MLHADQVLDSTCSTVDIFNIYNKNLTKIEKKSFWKDTGLKYEKINVAKMNEVNKKKIHFKTW